MSPHTKSSPVSTRAADVRPLAATATHLEGSPICSAVGVMSAETSPTPSFPKALLPQMKIVLRVELDELIARMTSPQRSRIPSGAVPPLRYSLVVVLLVLVLVVSTRQRSDCECDSESVESEPGVKMVLVNSCRIGPISAGRSIDREILDLRST